MKLPGFGDFIDVELDDNGRPWIALAHNTAGSDEAIIATLTEAYWTTFPDYCYRKIHIWLN